MLLASAAPSPSSRAERRALLLRLFGDFALRWFERAKNDFGGDYEMAAVLVAILQANIGRVARDPQLNRQYGDRPPPDHLRDPVSLREAARAIDMSRERFRRKAGVLVAFEAVKLVDEGYIVPAATIRTESSRLHARAFQRLHRRLQAAGFEIADLPVTDAPQAWRQGILRLLGDAFIAWVRLAAEPLGGDLRLAVVFATVMQAGDFPKAEAGETVPRAIAINALAASLALPRESVRRYAAALVERGWLQRVEGGMTVAPAILDSEDIAFVEPLYELTRDLFARLAAQGATFGADDPAG